MNFYQKFVRLCNDAKIPPTTAAIEIGMKRSAVTRWKDGGRPTDASLLKICDYFNVEPSYFDDDEPSGEMPREDIYKKEEAVLLTYFNQLNEEGQRTLLNLAHSLVIGGLYSRASSHSGIA